MTSEKKPDYPLPPVLDVCCGSRIFWFDPKNPQGYFVDIREEKTTYNAGYGRFRDLQVSPDKVADFRDLPFEDDSFYLVVFDPPHITNLGEKSWMAKKYGRLTPNWREDIKAGFEECFRVLKPNGTLVFKWNEQSIPVSKVLELSPVPPLFGHKSGRMGKTIWAVFIKPYGG